MGYPARVGPFQRQVVVVAVGVAGSGSSFHASSCQGSPTFATPGAPLRRLQPRGSQILLQGALTSPPPPSTGCGGRHTQTGQRGEVPRPNRERGSPRIPSPTVPGGRGPAWGGGGLGEGVAAPQSRYRGAKPRCCDNRFQANQWLLAPRSVSLAHWRPPSPSLPPCSGGWERGWPGPGSKAETRARARIRPREGGWPRDCLPSALHAHRLAAAAAVLTGPGILLELVLLALGERRGPRGQSLRPGGGDSSPRKLTVAAKAAPSEGLEPRGARTDAYTARPEPGVRARGRQSRAPAPHTSQRRRQSREPKAEDPHPPVEPGSLVTGNALATPHT